jgi:thiosulfate dehydrogenase
MSFEQAQWKGCLVLLLAGGLSCCVLQGCSASKTRLAAMNEQGRQLSSAESVQAGLVQKGKLIFDETPKYAASYVGNQLACGDCHLSSGKADYAAPMTDVASLFPMFSKRAGHVITLQDRIEECFVRSEAGKPLPATSEEMRGLVAYIQSLSTTEHGKEAYPGRGLVKLPPLHGDASRGRAIYVRAQCAICHGDDGAGVPPVLPPLWGHGSYNDGAGLDKPAKLAAYIFHNMPQNHPETLTAQEAFDVASYIDRQPRPHFNPAYKSF